MKSKKVKLIEIESRKVAAKCWGGVKWEMQSKGTNFKLKDEYTLMKSMAIIINNILLYIGKLLRKQILNVLTTEKK